MENFVAIWDIKNVPSQEELLHKSRMRESIPLNLQLRDSDPAITKHLLVVIEKIYPESGDGSTGHWIIETTDDHKGYVHTYGNRGYITRG